MHTSRSRRRRRTMAEINVVPYIDVMLVLLVIFMITTPLLTQGVKINMPEAPAKEIATKNDTPLIISVDARGNYYLNISRAPDLPISERDLITKVSAEMKRTKSQPRQVLVKGDQDVDYGKVVQAMVLLQKAGVAEIGLVTKQPEKSAK